MVLKQNKIIFIHATRTAGSSIEKFLCTKEQTDNWKGLDDDKPPTHRQHYSIKQIVDKRIIKERELDNYFKFCVVRNPYQRILSEYYEHFKIQNNISFETYIEHLYARGLEHRGSYQWDDEAKKFKITESKNSPKLYISTVKSLVCLNSEIKMDFILRFENLKEDWNTLTDKLNWEPSSLPVSNANRYDPGTKKYNKIPNKTKQYISEIYKEDFEEFKYEKTP